MYIHEYTLSPINIIFLYEIKDVKIKRIQLKRKLLCGFLCESIIRERINERTNIK